jgi:TRAP-type C4-dicarboxylate transport system permease small subunit
MQKFIKIYRDIFAYIGMLGLIGFIISVLVQVTARTFLPVAPNWTEEAARFLFIFMVATAGNAAILSDEYVGVEMLMEMFSAKVQKIFRLVIYIIMIAFSAYVFIACVVGPKGLLAITPPTMVSTALEIPMKYIYSFLAILFGFYIVSYVLRIYMLLTQDKEA